MISFVFSSADDPYLLYAALHCGMNTYVLSNDEMRDARFLLGDQMAERFKLWQRHRQIKFHGIWPNQSKEMQPHFVVRQWALFTKGTIRLELFLWLISLLY